LRNLKKGGNLSHKIEKDNLEEETENSYKNIDFLSHHEWLHLHNLILHETPRGSHHKTSLYLCIEPTLILKFFVINNYK
jgi:hypothetical protein